MSWPTTEPLRCSMRAFCFCLTLIILRTVSMAPGLLPWIVKPMTTGEMGVEPGWLVLLAVVDGATSICRGWGTAPLTVILRFLGEGGMSADGAGATSSSRSWLSCLTRTLDGVRRRVAEKKRERTHRRSPERASWTL